MKKEVVLQSRGHLPRRLREQWEWSQQVLVAVADVSKATIYRIETARYSATLNVLASLAQGLKIPFEEAMIPSDSNRRWDSLPKVNNSNS